MSRRLLLLVTWLLVGASVGQPCTILVVARGGQVLAAGNEDCPETPTFEKSYVRFVPADPEKKRMGFVSFGFASYPFADQAAMNEAGLFYDYNALPKLDTPREGKPAGMASRVYEMLTTCRTVAEAVEFIEAVDLAMFSSGQMVLGDATGASAIVERHTTTWRAKGADYQIGTNFRTSATPRDQVTCPRYLACDAGLRPGKPASVGSLVDLMRQTSAKPGSGVLTWYTVVCDLKRGEVNLYRKADFSSPTKFSLAAELKGGRRTLDMDAYVDSKAASLFGLDWTAL